MSVRCVSVCFVMMGRCSISEHVVKPCVLQRTRTKRHEERKGDERISDRSKPPKPDTQRRDCAVQTSRVPDTQGLTQDKKTRSCLFVFVYGVVLLGVLFNSTSVWLAWNKTCFAFRLFRAFLVTVYKWERKWGKEKHRGGEVDGMLIPARLNISMFRTVISYLSKHTYAAKVIPSLII